MIRFWLHAAVLALAAHMTAGQAAAQDRCMTVKTPKNRLIATSTRGYEPVQVRLFVPKTSAVEVPAQPVLYRFAISMDSPRALHDLNRWIRDIKRCNRNVVTANGKRYRVATTQLQVLGGVYGTGSAGFALSSNVLLPSEVVARRPSAATTLNFGVSFAGRWTRGEEGAVLTFYPKL